METTIHTLSSESILRWVAEIENTEKDFKLMRRDIAGVIARELENVRKTLVKIGQFSNEKIEELTQQKRKD